MYLYRKDGTKIETKNESTGDLVNPNRPLLEKLQAASISEHDCWWGIPRESGVYKLGSATAKLECGIAPHPDKPDSRFQKLEISGPDLDDLCELYQLIRAGDILPHILYDKKQVDSPVRQFRDLVREFFRLLRIHLRSRFATGG